MNRQDFVVIFLVKLDVFGVVKDAEQVRLDGVRVAGLPENLKQGRVRNEEESREQKTFLLQVAGEEKREGMP